MLNPSDFASVQFGRKMTALAQQFAGVSPQDLRKFSTFLSKLADLRDHEAELTEAQLQVIMQNLRSKELTKLEPHKGGIMVEFTGGGFEYERFLLRDDGRMPNSRYEAKKVQ
ncbi:MAG TPA: hypothetical protein PKE64_21115 [Anaerolineae bacterium]|nr:hypothetical protein [Anaerolineae bacterium]HMR66522.1 hypothetical protein [Anaerolineae bacterium]